MSEDPYIIVNEDVNKTLGITRGLLQRWLDIQQDDSSIVSQGEFDWTTKELLNSLKSLEWDLEDLDEAFSIIEKNPKKFKVDSSELTVRRQLIDKVKKEFFDIRERINVPREGDKDADRTARQPLLEEPLVNLSNSSQMHNNPVSSVGPFGNTKYSRLQNQLDSPSSNHGFDPDDLSSSSSPQHQGILNSPMISSKVVHDEESVMLDEMDGEIAQGDLKLDNFLYRIGKRLRNSNNKFRLIGLGIVSSIIITGITLILLLY